MKTQLPPPGPELLRLALHDLEAVENDPRYKVNMGAWISWEPDGTCEVCLAGSIMAKSLGWTPVTAGIQRRRGRLDSRWYWLDDVRKGVVQFSCDNGYPRLSFFHFPEYEEDPDGFKDALYWICDHWPKEVNRTSITRMEIAFKGRRPAKRFITRMEIAFKGRRPAKRFITRMEIAFEGRRPAKRNKGVPKSRALALIPPLAPSA